MNIGYLMIKWLVWRVSKIQKTYCNVVGFQRVEEKWKNRDHL